MVIVVDTTVWSETLRSAPDPAVLSWMRRHSADLHLPATVVHELRFGIDLLPPGRRREEIENRIERMLSHVLDRVLPYDAATARVHATLRARARSVGREPSAEDGQVAATAAVRGVPVATRNTGDFEHLGVTVVDPWADPQP